MTRIRSLDYARGFTVLFIPAIHTGMLYSQPVVHESLLGQSLIAIAEGPGGQLLMLLMGISFALKDKHHPTLVGLKAVGLLLAGYTLNILKFVVPYSFDALPIAVLEELQITGSGTSAVFQLTGMGDILHFAAFALPVLYIVYQQPRYYQWAILLAVADVIISPWCWDLQSGNAALDYVLELITGAPPQVFFPLFPWLVYPLTGLCIGHYWKRDAQQTATHCAIIGAVLVGVGYAFETAFPVENPAGFYRTGIAATGWHLGVVLLSLAAWHVISEKMKPNAFTRLLEFASRQITAIYIIQWVMICWALPVISYQTLDIELSALMMVIMTANTFLITYTVQLIKNYHGNK